MKGWVRTELDRVRDVSGVHGSDDCKCIRSRAYNKPSTGLRIDCWTEPGRGRVRLLPRSHCVISVSLLDCKRSSGESIQFRENRIKQRCVEPHPKSDATGKLYDGGSGHPYAKIDKIIWSAKI